MLIDAWNVIVLDPLHLMICHWRLGTSSKMFEQHTRTTSSSTVRHTTSSTEPLPTLTTPTPSTATAVAYVTSSLNTVTPTATPEPQSDGPGAGPIIGIVAGALAGVALLAAIIGFVVKKVRSKEDPYESNPFDRDDFRRQSAMLPENFDDEDGAPSMSEHQHNNLAAAGYGAAAAAGGMAYAGASQSSHNASGGPRPPTMFERHMAGPGAQYAFDDATAPPVPQVGAVFNQGPAPSLPPMAFGGSDPYTLAGVGNRDHENFNNSVNPYAHLDRNRSLGSDRGYQPNFQPGQLAFGAQGSQRETDLDRAGSNGSDFSQGQALDAATQNGRDLISPFTNPHETFAHHGVGQQFEDDHAYDTAGRPGTAEGRSGTPDLDNPQNHYAPTDTINGDQRHYQTSPEPSARAASPFNALDSPPQQPLQVRNLLPGHPQQQQRPISTATEDPSDAYGGCY
ncbi:hypothetical protein IE81DRAFT_113602 [Ceraceosorus guamensis]|uniref:CTX-RELATED TYPE I TRANSMEMBRANE PROTEIN n=1 Tax=Ceraceosorus guamensis TaxID=1522189 RepID=A0A316W525_9BASI|nr:hypothetical protein IE81DRAFT_113602 [Ceraceosorus guamensis]PWN42745.1 hypothetical protein IE81DRAFT_113602 [Ceraceosorus guamensis]